VELQLELPYLLPHPMLCKGAQGAVLQGRVLAIGPALQQRSTRQAHLLQVLISVPAGSANKWRGGI